MAETKTTFTPGPWAAGPQGLGGHVWIRSDDGDFIVSVPKGYNNPQKANAHLIAAAPDLYAAASEIIRLHDTYTGEAREDDAISLAMDELRAALARANGEG